MTLISKWVYAASDSIPEFTQSSVSFHLWDIVKASSPEGQVYVGAAPALMHMATPSIWPVCYLPNWCARNRKMMLENAPDKLSWVLTRWVLDFLPIRSMDEAPMGQKCAIVYAGMYGLQNSCGRVIDIWPEWPTARRIVPMAIFRPIYNSNLVLPTIDMINSFEESMASFVEARNNSGIPDAVAGLNTDNPFLHHDSSSAVDYDEDEDEEDDFYDQEPDYE